MSLRELELSGKVAVVTGAGRGIGRAIALAYAHAGAMVSCAARTQAEIDDTVREIESFGGEGIAVRTDVTQLASVQNLYRATTQRFGGIDLLVVNAGASYDRRTIEESDVVPMAMFLATQPVMGPTGQSFSLMRRDL